MLRLLRRVSECRGTAWLAYSRGRLVGWALVEPKGRFHYFQVYVDPAFRRKGVGRNLFQHAYALAGQTLRANMWDDWSGEFFNSMLRRVGDFSFVGVRD